MFNLLKKCAFALVAVTSVTSSLAAFDSYNTCDCGGRGYIGAFGGGLFSNRTHAYQMGTAFFEEAVGGPLAVYGHGHLKSRSSGFGGLQLGYRWSPECIPCSNWSVGSAAEFEAFWFGATRRGHFINPTNRLPEHDFNNSFRMSAGVYLANWVFTLNNNDFCGSWFSQFSPYVGVGIGASRITLDKAKSFQLAPPEAGINHFNSRDHDSAWAFAAQVKVGLKYQICEALHFFGEYRYLYLDTTNYIFGSTVYPNHAVTSPWNVNWRSLQYNAVAFGIQYDL